MGDFVRVETSSGVATIRVDRPKMNALNPQVLAELTEAANAVGADPDVRAAVIWGGPRIFAAGADIGGFTGLAPAEAEALSRQFNDAFLAVENMPQITVAAVNGYALGGGMELAMAAEFRVAADDAVFGQPEIKLGIIPGGGGTQRLPRLVGITKAKEIIYTGRNVYPDEALAIGLVSAVHPAEETYDAAVEMAAGYAAGPAALRMAKQAVMDGLPLSLADAVARETHHFGECFTTDDSAIGVASFLERGPARRPSPAASRQFWSPPPELAAHDAQTGTHRCQFPKPRPARPGIGSPRRPNRHPPLPIQIQATSRRSSLTAARIRPATDTAARTTSAVVVV